MTDRPTDRQADHTDTQARQRELSAATLEQLKANYLDLETTHKYWFRERGDR